MFLPVFGELARFTIARDHLTSGLRRLLTRPPHHRRRTVSHCKKKSGVSPPMDEWSMLPENCLVKLVLQEHRLRTKSGGPYAQPQIAPAVRTSQPPGIKVRKRAHIKPAMSCRQMYMAFAKRPFTHPHVSKTLFSTFSPLALQSATHGNHKGTAAETCNRKAPLRIEISEPRALSDLWACLELVPERCRFASERCAAKRTEGSMVRKWSEKWTCNSRPPYCFLEDSYYYYDLPL